MQQEVTAKRGELDALQNKLVFTLAQLYVYTLSNYGLSLSCQDYNHVQRLQDAYI